MELHVPKADAPSISGSPIRNVAAVIPQTASAPKCMLAAQLMALTQQHTGLVGLK